jgi:hypothetical protein
MSPTNMTNTHLVRLLRCDSERLEHLLQFRIVSKGVESELGPHGMSATEQLNYKYIKH